MAPVFTAAPAADVSLPGWSASACDQLKRDGYVRLKLTPTEAATFRELWSATHTFFEDREAMRELEIPDGAADLLDERSGYVYGRNRELFELHPECPSAAALEGQLEASRQLLSVAWAITGICQKRCDDVLEQIAASTPSSGLKELLASRETAADEKSSASKSPNENMLRIYRYSRSYDRSNGDVDTHFDMGTLSIVPKASCPGLFMQPTSVEEAPNQAAGRLPATDCVAIEEQMGDDEVLMFVGMTLARLTGIPALKHGVFTDGKVRYSAPFFQRFAPWCELPASQGHPRETVSDFNKRLRDAENEELRGSGAVVFEKRCDDAAEYPKQARPWGNWKADGGHKMGDSGAGYHSNYGEGPHDWASSRRGGWHCGYNSGDCGGHHDSWGPYRSRGSRHNRWSPWGAKVSTA